MDVASHFITELDRVDARSVRQARLTPTAQSVAPGPSLAERDFHGHLSLGARFARSFKMMNADKPTVTVAMPRDLSRFQSLAEQQERPHDRQGRLRHLRDPDRADRDRLLRVDHQPVGSDTGQEREDQHVRPAGAAQPEHVAIGDRQR